MFQDVINSWDSFVKGDKEAFGDIYQKYLPVLTLYCLGILRDKQSAEHCAAEALIKTMNHHNPITISDPEKWLFIVAKNQCISELRKVKRLDAREPQESQTITQQPDSLLKEEIDIIIESTLTNEERGIWEFHSNGFTNAEIAEKFDSNSKTIANKKSEIRNKLRKAFADHLNLGKKYS